MLSSLSLVLFLSLHLLDVLLLSVLPPCLLVLNGLDPDLFDFELDAAELDDVVLSQFVVEFLISLFYAAHHQVHALSHIGRQLPLWRLRLGQVVRLVLRQQIVIFWHFGGIQEVLVYKKDIRKLYSYF